MYQWGYLKEAALAKLDLTEDEAAEQNLIEKFPFYANEVITQVCSAIKPKWTFAEFVVTDSNLHTKLTMPSDFICFGDDVNLITETEFGITSTRAATDYDFRYVGYNEVMFFNIGVYRISYNARWIDFNSIEREDDDGVSYTGPIDDSYVINVPADILDCIPNYIASQCFKIDDQYKSQVFRNEYEMSLARIDNTNYKNTKTFVVGGDW